jgi:methylenetetrahydrofolate reductase (NADPH)
VIDEGSRQALLASLHKASFEIIPIKGIEKKVHHLPAGSKVAISCSSEKGVQATLDLARHLKDRGFDLIPHVAARGVENEQHLHDILGQLAELGVDRLFVVGGDAEQPLGRFDSSLQLLEAMSEIDHGISTIGVGAYPEGHPLIDDETLFRYLQSKQPFAAYLVTQMCFDPEAIVSWLRRIRAEGVDLPIKIGIPGVGDRAKLLQIALRIGVGQSTRFLKSNLKLVGKMARPRGYTPDQLVLDLGPAMADTVTEISAFHLYTFNQVESTEEWRLRMMTRLEEGSI